MQEQTKLCQNGSSLYIMKQQHRKYRFWRKYKISRNHPSSLLKLPWISLSANIKLFYHSWGDFQNHGEQLQKVYDIQITLIANVINSVQFP